ncbi:DUF2306 domain-containing protein [Agromyces sp. H66]|uniref:DUF2306 domain-containing protein n=1 Tax=Agromyces sp. H66 TaxID=2529859 RepID=UPI0010AB4023|nr:DUF2306 domain-containing protein [Agromyces sp. H66]
MTSGTSRPLRSDDAARSRGSAPALRVGARSGWALVALSSLAIAAFAVVPYLTSSLAELSESGVGVAGTYDGRPAVVQAAFYAHVVAGGIALVAGPFQFWRGLRDRQRSVHRWIGRGYLAAVAIAAVAGLVIAPFSEAGLSGLVGFGSLAVLWLATGSAAYRAIRRGDVANHRAWMMRNFALTYAAVTLRLWLGALIGAQALPGGPFDLEAAFANAYAVVPFLSWLPNLVVVEWLIRRRGLPAFRLVPGNETPSRVRG